MTKYLNTKPGSVEEVVANMNKSLRQDGAYQDMFKKELDKAGKGIGSMSPKEKKDFFNKIDSKYKAKDEGFASDAQRKAAFASGYKAKDKKEDLDNKDKSVVSKVVSALKKVYDRGMAAWKGGHRPGATQQQWAFARVNSFVTKSSGTWGGADKDLAAKVRGSK